MPINTLCTTVLRIAILLAPLTFGACSATVDQFSNRAQAYNDQADTIKEQQLLLNILRAAYREPMEFSDFTQVTGQNTVSGSLGFSLPISGFPTLAPRTYLTTPSASITGTQSFTVANLDTQAFYEGLLSPIPLTTLDYYMESDYPKALVLTLFVDQVKLIPMGAAAAANPAIAGMTYGNTYQYGRYGPFRAIIDTAIYAGIDTEIVRDMTPIGPPMSAKQLHAVKDLASLIGEGVTLKTYRRSMLKPGPEGPRALFHDPQFTDAQIATILPAGATEYYRLVRTSAVPRFCFDRAGAAALQGAESIAMINAYLHREYAISGKLNLVDISIPEAAYCGQEDLPSEIAGHSGGAETTTPLQITLQAAAFNGAPKVKFRVAITTRSVEQMIYYLGEWTRAETGLAGDIQPPPLVSTSIDPPGSHIAQAPGEYPPASGSEALPGNNDILFRVRPDRRCASGLPSVSVRYFHADYCMQIDPTGHDRSSQVMEIVAQLFALNNAAKDLPSPNVISVLSP